MSHPPVLHATSRRPRVDVIHGWMSYVGFVDMGVSENRGYPKIDGL